MNPLLRSWWWSSESQQGFVGSRIWDVGLFLSDWGWNTTFFTGTGELLSLGETWTSHGSIFSPLQLMFYVVPGVNRCPDDFEIPACESCKDWEIHTSVELSPAGSCGLCQQPGAAPRTPCLPRWVQRFSSFQPGCCSEGCLLVPLLCVGCGVVFKCGASGANIPFWETPHGVGRHQ